MAESAALLVDEVLPHEPMRQWVLSVPFPLRFVFASRPEIMGKVAGFSLPQGTLSPRPGSHLVHAGVAAKADEHKKLDYVFYRTISSNV